MANGMRRFEKILSRIFTAYIDFVFKTSKVTKNGNFELLKNGSEEKYIISFWHGDSYCLYPVLNGEKLYVITTKDTRGDYISLICEYFGYHTIRVPDNVSGGHFLYEIKSSINGDNGGNLAVAADGPLGPLHEPKSLLFVIALHSKRKIIPVSIKCKRKIRSKRRWDKYSIPLPFNQITATVHEPIEVAKADLKEDFEHLKIKIKQTSGDC